MNSPQGASVKKPARLALAAAAMLALVLVALGGCEKPPTVVIPAPRAVDVARPGHTRIVESFTEAGRTRLAREYLVTMPVAGRISRLAVEPGDRVTSGQTLAEYDLVPFDNAVSETRAVVSEYEQRIRINQYDNVEQRLIADCLSGIEAFRKALSAANAQIEAEKARKQRADAEVERFRRLVEDRNAPQTELDAALRYADQAAIGLRRQEFMRAAIDTIFSAFQAGPHFIEERLARKRLEGQALVYQLAQARARLHYAQYERALASIRSPLNGVVLERLEEGGRVLPAGAPLARLGDLGEMEVVVEVLTPDALRLSPGSEVELEIAPGRPALPGKVKRIEPAGFTRTPPQGAEEQRVNVIVAFSARPPADLGVGFRIQARFLTGRHSRALTVPRSSVLQGPDGGYFVYVVEKGRLARRPVKLGLRSDLEYEITEGLGESDSFVPAPDPTFQENEPVTIRE